MVAELRTGTADLEKLARENLEAFIEHLLWAKILALESNELRYYLRNAPD